MTVSFAVTPAANARYSEQPAHLGGTQTAANVFTAWTEDELYSPAIPAALGSNLLSTPVTLDRRFVGLHITEADAARRVTVGTARSVDQCTWRWAQLNPSSGVYAPGTLPAWLRTMKDAGAETIVTVWGTPTWASARPAEGPDQYGNAGGLAEPASMASLTAFVTWLMTNYGDRIDALEVWNEPKYQYGGASYFSGTPAKLAEMARTINQAAKAIKPTVKVVGVSCTGVTYNSVGSGIDYCNQFLAASDGAGGFGRDWIDALTVHTYVHDGTNDLSLVPGIKGFLQTIMVANGIGSMPVWSTEFGYITPSFDTYTGPAIAKAAALARYTVLNAVAGMARSVAYSYGSSLGWQRDPVFDQAWNQWATLLNGATLSVVNRIGAKGALACVIDGRRYLV